MEGHPWAFRALEGVKHRRFSTRGGVMYSMLTREPGIPPDVEIEGRPQIGVPPCIPSLIHVIQQNGLWTIFEIHSFVDHGNPRNCGAPG